MVLLVLYEQGYFMMPQPWMKAMIPKEGDRQYTWPAPGSGKSMVAEVYRGGEWRPLRCVDGEWLELEEARK